MLCGHSDTVTCASVSVEFGIVASGSKDRRVLLHSIHNGRLLRSFSDRKEQQQLDEEGEATILRRKRRQTSKDKEGPTFSLSKSNNNININGRDLASMGGVEMVVASRVSAIVVSYYSHPNVLSVHTFNGVLLQQLNLDELNEENGAGAECKAMKVMPRRKDDKEYLLLGGKGGITVRALPFLSLVCHFDIPSSPVVSLSYIEDSFVFAGLEDGQVAVFPLFIVNSAA